MSNGKKVSCAFVLAVIRIVLSFSAILGIFTRLPHIFSGGLIGLLNYLISGVVTLAPLLILVLLYLNQKKTQTKNAALLCFLIGIACFARLVLSVLTNLANIATPEFILQMSGFGSSYLACGILYTKMASNLKNGSAAGKFSASHLLVLFLLFIVAMTMIMSIIMDAGGFPFWDCTPALWLVAIGYFLPALFLKDANAQYIPGPKTSQVVVIVAVLLAISVIQTPSHRTPSYSSKDYSFEDYLKDNDPDSYQFYKDIEAGWDAGRWDPENGFAGG